MAELKVGTVVHLTNGESVTVEQELGRGGQGIVYMVSHMGIKKALKWYITCPDERFMKNLRDNAMSGTPSKFFLWPEATTVFENGSAGYIMRLRPQGYYDFSSFILAKHNFSSVLAMTVAAMEICEAFKDLHAQGLSYQDLNDGNFFIDPNTGHILICDNDNVFPHKQNSGIKGKARYMAPEIVIGKNNPDAYSDKFSLALILFMVIYGNHPFEGARLKECPCMTESFERKFYGEEITFIMDPTDNSNRPVKGCHNNVIRRWGFFPKIIREAFERDFSKEIMANPQRRLTELQWLDILTKFRDSLVICPHCGEETFVSIGERNICSGCNKAIEISNTLSLDGRTLVLTQGNNLYLDRDEIPDVKIVRGEDGDRYDLWIKNISNTQWSVTTPSGRTKIVGAQEKMPVKTGLVVSFGKFNKKGTIN